jgi:hypothetical protein
MKEELKDWSHLLRMAGLFAALFVVFLVARAALVPPGFGEYGFFRAGALLDNREKPLSYAGRGACAECHDEVVTAKKAGPHAGLGCETCHGPLAAHAADATTARPELPDPRATCVNCHERNVGKPKWFKTIVVEDHAPSGPCKDCHVPHNPAIG